MKKYIYTQNNTGGSYEYPEWTGPSDLGGVFTLYPDGHYKIDGPVDVWVLAESTDEADALVQEYAGVYFQGVGSGLDCECCGDRWYRADDLFTYPIN